MKNLKALGLKAIIVLFVTGFFFAAGINAQNDNASGSYLMFSAPNAWVTTNNANGSTTYKSPDNISYVTIYPYRGTTSSESITPSGTRRELLAKYLSDNNWTADNSTYTPFYINGLEGVYTTAHTTIDGNNYTGYVYYGNDKEFPDRSYYYYLYTPTSNWETNQSDLQKLLMDLRYTPHKMTK